MTGRAGSRRVVASASIFRRGMWMAPGRCSSSYSSRARTSTSWAPVSVRRRTSSRPMSRGMPPVCHRAELGGRGLRLVLLLVGLVAGPVLLGDPTSTALGTGPLLTLGPLRPRLWDDLVALAAGLLGLLRSFGHGIP